jgi:hypothetical protein
MSAPADKSLAFYRVWMRSAAGIWERYEGHVDTWASDEDEAFERAVRQLARSSFRDRPRTSDWQLVRIELLHSG